MAERRMEWDDLRVPSRVLIVDDHPTFRAMAKTVLIEGGFVVVGEAVDADSAFAAVRELRPDCVLLDVQLGDMDGFEVADALAGEANAPAIVLTSGREPSELQPLVEASTARGFIPKEMLSANGLGELLR